MAGIAFEGSKSGICVGRQIRTRMVTCDEFEWPSLVTARNCSRNHCQSEYGPSATNNRQNWDRRANKTDSPDASEKACLTMAVYRAKLYDAKRDSLLLTIVTP